MRCGTKLLFATLCFGGAMALSLDELLARDVESMTPEEFAQYRKALWESIIQPRENYIAESYSTGVRLENKNTLFNGAPLVDSQILQSKINVEELNQTAFDLYHLAEASIDKYGHPTRVIGSPGHKKTINYILDFFSTDEMKKYYTVTVQPFDTVTGSIIDEKLSYENGDKIGDATALAMSPAVKEFQGELVHIPNYGCEEKDFRGIELNGDSIALIERGVCLFGVKSDLAGKFGFKSALIYNNEDNNDTPTTGTLGTPTENTVATIGISQSLGLKLVEAIGNAKRDNKAVKMNFFVDSTVSKITTENVIVDTIHGDPDNIVALGAHSDSVEAGPGINDDGSGTISLLLVAKYLKDFEVTNKVRFCWWSAEEEGLLGSNHYVRQLSREENLKIRMFMDYDMMASPNYQYQIYDANNKANPVGSEELKQLYIDYYIAHGINYTMIPFDGRSDYVGFIENGIPGGGIATGAEGINSENNEPFDNCYHQLCDDTNNLAFEAFLLNTKLIAHSVATYAKSLDGFPTRETKVTTLSAATVAEARSGNKTPKFQYLGPNLVY